MNVVWTYNELDKDDQGLGCCPICNAGEHSILYPGNVIRKGDPEKITRDGKHIHDDNCYTYQWKCTKHGHEFIMSNYRKCPICEYHVREDRKLVHRRKT